MFDDQENVEEEREPSIWEDKRPRWEKGRYIDLHGDAVHASRLSKIFNSIDFQTGCLAVVGMGVVSDLDPFLVAGAALLNLRDSSRGRAVEGAIYKTLFNDRVIDTKPDLEKSVPSPNDMLVAGAVSQSHICTFNKWWLLKAALVAIAPPLAFLYVTDMARKISAKNRFNKLASGEWQFVDEPRPPPKEAKEEAVELDGAPSFG